MKENFKEESKEIQEAQNNQVTELKSQLEEETKAKDAYYIEL